MYLIERLGVMKEVFKKGLVKCYLCGRKFNPNAKKYVGCGACCSGCCTKSPMGPFVK